MKKTGRLAKHEPEMQNIPLRTQEDRGIRAAFQPKAGEMVIDADYSQIELRILDMIKGS